MAKDDVLTRNDKEELSVRVVSSNGDTVANKDDVYTRDTNGNLAVRIVGAGGGGSGAVDSVNGKTGVVVLTGEDISADVSDYVDTVQGHLQHLTDKVKDIELVKSPNVIIIGEPTIQHGQISDFSTDNYLQFPRVLDMHDKAFQIDMCFTTGEDVITQQNILDSKFGIALAIKDGKGLMAISSDGQSWNIGNVSGSIDIRPNTTYYARLVWNKLQYKTLISTDGSNYVEDMVLVGATRPFPTTMFIGGCNQTETGHEPHPFFGTINMNYAYLYENGQIVWEGMDDVGLGTRADISLDNLDAKGLERLYAWQPVVGNINSVLDSINGEII